MTRIAPALKVNINMSEHGPTTLIILDGWGIAPDTEGNAITQARTPFVDSLSAAYPHNQLACFGEAVGLPEGQMGNSEVGHLNLGAGRVVNQDITRINRSVREGGLRGNMVLAKAMRAVQKSGGALHLMGLLSDGGVHSLQTHLYALIEMAWENGLDDIFIHAFLDGRDTPPDSGADYMAQLMDFTKDYPQAKVATISGRYWGMDRDKRWDRVEKSYNAMVRGQGEEAVDPAAAIKESYAKQELDEFMRPTVMKDESGEPIGLLKDGDAVIFFNFRADRAREITWALNSPDFNGFDVGDRPKLAAYVCMTRYDESLDLPVAFRPRELDDTLAEVVSKAGKRQLHIAETEKYAHVTFFFNGREEEPFAGEDRVLIPSPSDCDTYDEKPAMSAFEVTDEVIKRIESGGYDLIVMNYANGDMVGHTGVLAAAIEAVETLDACLARVIPAVLGAGGKVLLTADHGNAEEMIDCDRECVYTAHSVDNPVPLYYIAKDAAGYDLAGGALCDVAPTLLAMMDLEQPRAMTGRSLLLAKED